jgi:hypothetical protein
MVTKTKKNGGVFIVFNGDKGEAAPGTIVYKTDTETGRIQQMIILGKRGNKGKKFQVNGIDNIKDLCRNILAICDDQVIKK